MHIIVIVGLDPTIQTPSPLFPFLLINTGSGCQSSLIALPLALFDGVATRCIPPVYPVDIMLETNPTLVQPRFVSPQKSRCGQGVGSNASRQSEILLTDARCVTIGLLLSEQESSGGELKQSRRDEKAYG